MKKIVNFIFETSVLKRLPRSGWHTLGVSFESVAEHSWHTAVIGFVIASLSGSDAEKVALILLIHDIAEIRTGDINKLQAHYVKDDELKAVNDQILGLPFAKKYKNLVDEYIANKTVESKIAHDADVLALLVRLKEFMDKGNKQADRWFFANRDRLRTKVGIELGKELEKTDSQDWWNDIKAKVHKSYLAQ